MVLSVAFLIFALAVTLVISLVVYRVRGIKYALAAGGLSLLGMYALFFVIIAISTSQM